MEPSVEPSIVHQQNICVCLPTVVPRPKVGDVVNGKYHVIKKIGEGGFGVVLEVLVENGKHYAMKVEVEPPPENEPGLDLETAVLKRLQGFGHILRFIDEGKYLGEYNFVVMQLAGPNLADLRKRFPQQRFTNSTTIRLALQCLEGIEAVHTAGFVHRDIKPANFAVGYAHCERRNVFIFDFGLVRRFRMKNGAVRPQRETAGFRGSYQYASINAHNSVDLGRCDDLWSWLYSVVQMRVGKLPWRKENGRLNIGAFKASVSKEDLLKNMEPEFQKIHESLAVLKYADEPPYAAYRNNLLKIVRRKNYSDEAPFDWEDYRTVFSIDGELMGAEQSDRPVEKVDEKSVILI